MYGPRRLLPETWDSQSGRSIPDLVPRGQMTNWPFAVTDISIGGSKSKIMVGDKRIMLPRHRLESASDAQISDYYVPPSSFASSCSILKMQ